MPESIAIGIAVLGAIALIKWLVYTGLLWGMIKIQKLNYNLPGLFASSLLATLVGFIPFVGGYVSWAVLVICLWKCTGADIFPDVVFTVAIAGALMFCLNLWAFGAMMPGPEEMREAVINVPAEEERQKALAEALEPGHEERDEALADIIPVEPERPVTTAKSAPEVKPGMTVSARTAETKPSPLLSQISSNMIVVKGISPHTARPTVMIQVGRQVQTMMVGDSFSGSTLKGRIHLRCEQITATNVVFSLADGARLELPVK